MAILNLDFLNKNQFRSYPLKANASRTAQDGRRVRDNLLTACSVSTVISRTNIHINQIYVNGTYISVTLGCLENGKFKSLGRFYGEVTADFTTLELVQFDRFTGGSIVLGAAEEILNMAGGYYFSPEALPLEESTIFYYTPPGVTGIRRESTTLRGRVGFGRLLNLKKSTDRTSNQISLGVEDNTALASLADFSSDFNNCRTPLIHYVNGAKPFYNNDNPENQGNLYLVGVQPVVFYGVMGDGSLEVATKLFTGDDLTMNTLCSARGSVLPPVAPAYLTDRESENPIFKGKENYYSKSFEPPENLISHSEPEFLSWPQFLKNFFKQILNLESNTLYEVAAVGSETGDFHRVVLSNTGNSRLVVSLMKNGVVISDLEEIELLPGTKLVKKIKNPITLAQGLKIELRGDQLEDSVSALQVMLFYR